MHAKVIVADDLTVIGTINLDAWALYRNLEIAIIVEDQTLADGFSRDFVEPQILRSQPGEVPETTRERIRNWLMDRIAYFL